MLHRPVLIGALGVLLLSGCAAAPDPGAGRTAGEGGAASSGSPTSGGAPPATRSGSSAPAADGGAATQVVQVYFNRFDDNASSCSAVESVAREVPEIEAVATAALNQLFEGPTDEERRRGLTSLFGAGTRDLLRTVRVDEGVAYLDLDRSFLDLHDASTSCGGSALMASVEATLEQFPTVDGVRYAVEGQPQQFYEFVQIGCPPTSAAGNRCDPEPFGS